MTLVEFLLARIAEDERAAQAAADRMPLIYDTAVLRDKGVGLAQASHIARHDPARVLAECDAKRRIVELVTDSGQIPWDRMAYANRDVLRLLALPYADHPDYREEWKP